jgi:hypothetical protein
MPNFRASDILRLGSTVDLRLDRARSEASDEICDCFLKPSIFILSKWALTCGRAHDVGPLTESNLQLFFASHGAHLG